MKVHRKSAYGDFVELLSTIKSGKKKIYFKKVGEWFEKF